MRIVTSIIGVFLIAAVLAPQQYSFGQEQGKARSLDVDADEQSDVASPKPIKRRWAFLVGIDKYNSFPDLDYCSADMEKLRETLIKHGGYDAECVKTLTYNEQSKFNVSSGIIRVELLNMLEKVGPDDSILFAFSGHGDVDSDGKAWLMPPDAKPGSSKVSVSEVYELLGDTEARPHWRVFQRNFRQPARQQLLPLQRQRPCLRCCSPSSSRDLLPVHRNKYNHLVVENRYLAELNSNVE